MMESVLFAILAAGSVVTAILVRRVALDVKRLTMDVLLLRSAVGDLNAPLYDTKRKQDEVLAAVGKHSDDVLKLLEGIRDLNHSELNDKREILTQTNIKATSRVTSTKDWMARLEAEANKAMLGLGSDRS